jgi:hypothetical protein
MLLLVHEYQFLEFLVQLLVRLHDFGVGLSQCVVVELLQLVRLMQAFQLSLRRLQLLVVLYGIGIAVLSLSVSSVWSLRAIAARSSVICELICY